MMVRDGREMQVLDVPCECREQLPNVHKRRCDPRHNAAAAAVAIAAAAAGVAAAVAAAGGRRCVAQRAAWLQRHRAQARRRAPESVPRQQREARAGQVVAVAYGATAARAAPERAPK
eukprot:167545-Chlamydomonas_euryale.AAC.1